MFYSRSTAILLICITLPLIATEPKTVPRCKAVIKEDRSNENWEQLFFGKRLATMVKLEEIEDAMIVDTDTETADTVNDQDKIVKQPKTVEIEVDQGTIHEEAAEPNQPRKVKKRIIYGTQPNQQPPQSQ